MGTSFYFPPLLGGLLRALYTKSGQMKSLLTYFVLRALFQRRRGLSAGGDGRTVAGEDSAVGAGAVLGQEIEAGNGQKPLHLPHGCDKMERNPTQETRKGMEINWYPGHMAKSRRLLMDQLKRVDVVLEICDARLPDSSRNPELERLIAGKKRVLLLNKADLADPNLTAAWLRHFRSCGIEAAPYTATSGKAKDALALIDSAAREAVEKAEQKGMHKTVRAMVVGVPNVGKSTLINKLHGSGIAKTGDKPGVTRTNQWVNISTYLQLLDTPGLMWPKLEDQLAARRLCYIGSVKDDVVDLPMLTIHLL